MNELAQVTIALVLGMIAASTMIVWLVAADQVAKRGDRDV